jgi:hypothetical protein
MSVKPEEAQLVNVTGQDLEEDAHGVFRIARTIRMPIRFRCVLRAPGDENGVRALPADVGSPWLRETVH